ncbi:hypothetical protein SAMN05877842_102462 [Ureibacillus acetophenoni]|uniref:Uncharacterized protein n=1 Tax=Ureibacillus acetophenoni TaxID=614649 RepID=A0A285U3K7_9BACL|nr:hypothetical protein SAMN05877842_102462 [Ureibacillus acetophenoni]
MQSDLFWWILYGLGIAFGIFFWTAIIRSIYKTNRIRGISLIMIAISSVMFYFADIFNQFYAVFSTFGIVFLLLGGIMMVISFRKKLID